MAAKKTKCRLAGKVGYSTKKRAIRAKDRLNNATTKRAINAMTYAYKCPACDRWHLTSQGGAPLLPKRVMPPARPSKRVRRQKA